MVPTPNAGKSRSPSEPDHRGLASLHRTSCRVVPRDGDSPVPAGIKDLFLCALIGILVSGLVSLVILRNVRSQIGASKGHKPKGPWKSPLGRISDRIDESASAEDEADDAARAQREQS